MRLLVQDPLSAQANRGLIGAVREKSSREGPYLVAAKKVAVVDPGLKINNRSDLVVSTERSKKDGLKEMNSRRSSKEEGDGCCSKM